MITLSFYLLIKRTSVPRDAKCSYSLFIVLAQLLHAVLTQAQGKRLFIKDMAYYFMPPKGKPASIAPSLAKGSGIEAHRAIEDEPNANGTARHNELPAVSEPENPTVIPTVILAQFHFTFLIRHPRSSIPSYYRCTIPPLDEKTGFYTFLPSEAGYDELRRLFDYLRFTGQIGPDVAGQQKKSSSEGSASEPGAHQQICVVDADDLLDNPNGIIEAYCRSVGIKYDPEMLNWNKEDDEYATNMFASWSGFHDDALNSSSLKPRLHVCPTMPACENMQCIFIWLMNVGRRKRYSRTLMMKMQNGA